jgi:hypothetical protein
MLCGDTGCSDGQGRCYRVCPDRETPSVCDEGTVYCADRCRDLSTDILHCGACGHQCGFGGDQPGEICVEGQCVCPPEFTGSCGQDYCTNEQIDGSNCGACGNACGAGRLCCSGRCVGRTDAERFCEFCGYLGGWPQDCLGNEICDRGCALRVEIPKRKMQHLTTLKASNRSAILPMPSRTAITGISGFIRSIRNRTRSSPMCRIAINERRRIHTVELNWRICRIRPMGRTRSG